jgi:nitrogen regulatory protein PII
VQVPVPLVIVTVLPEIVQAPVAAIVTVRPDVDVAVAVNVVLIAAETGEAGNVIVWAANAAATVCTTLVAALKFPLPACEADSVQVPVPLVIVTVVPEIEQAPAAAIVTVRPEDDVAAAVNVVLNAAEAGEAGNVIVCVASAAAIVCTTLVAGPKFPLPACEAVSVQVPVPLVIVTMLPEIVQTPVAAMVTGRPDDDVAVAVNVVLNAAEAGEAGNVIVWVASFTVRVKPCVVVPVLFVAEKLMGKVPLVPGAGVPPRMPVSLFIVIPFGNGPLSVSFGAG